MNDVDCNEVIENKALVLDKTFNYFNFPEFIFDSAELYICTQLRLHCPQQERHLKLQN